ncbi:phage tail assembly chaperone [Pseudomonas sp.]|uniref:phage tail assembly chaperone n=1 Tax=Pseudomonas sp. TaxID=306 RepID=UPI0026DD38CD|nr:phage tail assembly chaperone [Pseudomonas sp.]MDO4235617.1 phage tail assembly chaperone [Pseudomonas sp.]
MTDLVFVPEDMGNKDWVSYLEWVADGGQTLPKSTVEEAANEERRWRDSELLDLAWLRDRHRDQAEMGADTTLTTEQYAELLSYMQLLRDWPQSDSFPDTSKRPVPPVWIKDQAR